MIVTVTSADSGTSVRWYASEDGAVPNAEIAAATAQGCHFLADAPTDVVDAAQAAHRELSRNPHADVRHYATHTIRNGHLEPADAPPPKPEPDTGAPVIDGGSSISTTPAPPADSADEDPEPEGGD